MRQEAIIAIGLAAALALSGGAIYVFFGDDAGDGGSSESADSPVGPLKMGGPGGTPNQNKDAKPAQPDDDDPPGNGTDGGDGNETQNKTTPDGGGNEPYAPLSWFPLDNPASILVGDLALDVAGFRFAAHIDATDPTDPKSVSATTEYDTWSPCVNVVPPAETPSNITVHAWELNRSAYVTYLENEGRALGLGNDAAFDAYGSGGRLDATVAAVPFQLKFDKAREGTGDGENPCKGDLETYLHMTAWVPADYENVVAGYWPVVMLEWEHEDGRTGTWSYFDHLVTPSEAPGARATGSLGGLDDEVDETVENGVSTDDVDDTVDETTGGLPLLQYDDPEDAANDARNGVHTDQEIFVIPYMTDSVDLLPETHIAMGLFFFESYVSHPSPSDDLTDLVGVGGFLYEDVNGAQKEIKRLSEEELLESVLGREGDGVPGVPGTGTKIDQYVQHLKDFEPGTEPGQTLVSWQDQLSADNLQDEGVSFLFEGWYVEQTHEQNGLREQVRVEFAPLVPLPMAVHIKAWYPVDAVPDQGSGPLGQYAGTRYSEISLSLWGVDLMPDAQQLLNDTCAEDDGVAEACDHVRTALTNPDEFDPVPEDEPGT